MTFSLNRNVIRWIIIVSSFIIISLILWNTYTFFQNFKVEERSKMKTWSVAQIDLNSMDNLDSDVNPVTSHVVTETIISTPVIVLDENGEVNRARNIDSLILNNPKKLKALVSQFESENQPIPVIMGAKVKQTIYYGNSPLLNKLK